MTPHHPLQPWVDLDTSSIGNFRIFSLRTARRRSPRTGLEHDFYVMECPDWVTVVAITEDEHLVLVEQFRHGTSTLEWEVPAGVMDPQEVDPIATGVRELREETGFTGGKASLIGTVFPNPALQNNRCQTVLVRGCVRTHDLELDGSEDIRVHLVPLSRLRELVSSGRIRHALALTALFHFELWRQSAEGQAENETGPTPVD